MNVLDNESAVEFYYELPDDDNGGVILGVPLDRLKRLLRSAK